jgi:hypothetical protein
VTSLLRLAAEGRTLLRLLIILLLVYVVLLVLRTFLAGGKRRHASERTLDKGEEMVLDPQCQSYVPKRDAFFQGDRYFCSPECAKLYLSK